MIINKAKISKFRGFNNVEFSLGEHLTLIAGQNGTQKSTLLGILTQTFTIPSKEHQFSDERPLTGGTYRSAFQDKFRLSPILDQAGSHLWTLYLHNKSLHPNIGVDGDFTIESISRDKQKNEGIRFWQKGNREAGSGYIQLPVIFLSLKRLIPIAEAGNIKTEDINLNDDEKKWFSESYNKILLSYDKLESVDYLISTNKNTLGVTTNYYDWNSNSAGQDNLGRILLSVLSFKRLMHKYDNDYIGGILAIDEIDATLYPASQVKLLDSLSSFCVNYKIQIIATTHSLHLLERIDELKKSKGRDKHFNTVYLKKVDNKVIVEESPSYDRIMHNLNVTIGKQVQKPKIEIYTEDAECMHFAKAILGRKFSNLLFPEITFGCGNLIELGRKKVTSFIYPNAIVILDGDAQGKLKSAKLKNYICLPGEQRPEAILANFLFKLSDASPFWSEKRVAGYSKQLCFKNYSLDKITSEKNGRVDAKNWYNEQLETGAWGRQASVAYKYLLDTQPDEKAAFLDGFEKLYNVMVKNNI